MDKRSLQSMIMMRAPKLAVRIMTSRFPDRQRIIDELRAHELFVRDLSSIGLKDIFYPVGGAASWYLLYLCLRVIRLGNVQNVLELGAGQSTLLFDVLRKQGLVQNVTTIESDPYWAQLMQSQVDHKIVLSPLKQEKIDGHITTAFDLTEIAGQKFDFVMVDGPIGSAKWSRLQAAAVLAEHTEQEFVMILDDALRSGEIQTAGQLLAKSMQRTPRPDSRWYVGEKSDFLLATPAYRAALYF